MWTTVKLTRIDRHTDWHSQEVKATQEAQSPASLSLPDLAVCRE